VTDEEKRAEGYDELLQRVAPGAANWTEIVGPLAARFEVAAKFNSSAVWNPTGSEAMAQLLTAMARILDTEIIARRKEGRDA
jgi:hypothetical protein